MKIHELLNEGPIDFIAKQGARLLAPAAKSILKTASKNPAVAQAAKKTAQKVAPNLTKAVTKSAGVMGPLVRVSGKVLTLLKALGIAKFVYDYYDDVEYGEEQVKKGIWSPEEFADYRQGKMTVLVTQIAASTVFIGVIKIFSGWSLLTNVLRFSRIPGINTFGVFLSNLDKTVSVGVMAALQTHEARKAIASLIGQGVVDDFLGGNGVALVDHAKQALGLNDTTSKIQQQADKDKEEKADKAEKEPENQAADMTIPKAKPTGPNDPTGFIGGSSTEYRSPKGLTIGMDPAFMNKK